MLVNINSIPANISEKSFEGTVALLTVACSIPSYHVPLDQQNPDFAFLFQTEHVRVSQLNMHGRMFRTSLIQSLSGVSVKGI